MNIIFYCWKRHKNIKCHFISYLYNTMMIKSYLYNFYKRIPLKPQYANKASEWILLFQVDIISNSEFELMIGDSGRLYYYIRKDDLMNKRFDKCWFMTQSL